MAVLELLDHDIETSLGRQRLVPRIAWAVESPLAFHGTTIKIRCLGLAAISNDPEKLRVLNGRYKFIGAEGGSFRGRGLGGTVVDHHDRRSRGLNIEDDISTGSVSSSVGAEVRFFFFCPGGEEITSMDELDSSRSVVSVFTSRADFRLDGPAFNDFVGEDMGEDSALVLELLEFGL
ncbi:hypothetical protein DFH09DRAFT_1099755 [Mycena vulgaris]|nr:hypothetical protein DFH09DRAFT_1099755 [Mycena vulgaris]